MGVLLSATNYKILKLYHKGLDNYSMTKKTANEFFLKMIKLYNAFIKESKSNREKVRNALLLYYKTCLKNNLKKKVFKKIPKYKNKHKKLYLGFCTSYSGISNLLISDTLELNFKQHFSIGIKFLWFFTATGGLWDPPGVPVEFGMYIDVSYGRIQAGAFGKKADNYSDFAFHALNLNFGFVLKFSKSPYIHNLYLTVGMANSFRISQGNINMKITQNSTNYLLQGELASTIFGFATSIGYFYTPLYKNYSFYAAVSFKFLIAFSEVYRKNLTTLIETQNYDFDSNLGNVYIGVEMGFLFSL